MATTARQAILDYCVMDVTVTTGAQAGALLDRGQVHVLRWIDPAYHDRGGPIGEFERERRFPHTGAAIAWARRQLFHGRVFGDAIEMETRLRTEYPNGRISESSHGIVDITLPGFCKWHDAGGTGYLALGKPVRKHGADW